MKRTPELDRFLEQRLDAVAAGLKEGVRREVARLRKVGLPVYVAHNGDVIALPPDSADPAAPDPTAPPPPPGG